MLETAITILAVLIILSIIAGLLWFIFVAFLATKIFNRIDEEFDKEFEDF